MFLYNNDGIESWFDWIFVRRCVFMFWMLNYG